MTNMPSRLLIVGASARAAATLVGVADLHACDLFADYDLCQVACADKIPATSFPSGFLDWASSRKVAGECDQSSGNSSVSVSSWMYTGGLENCPDLVDAISEQHRLLGCGGEVLAAVRDPFRLTRFLEQSQIDGVQSPAVSSTPIQSWDRILRKPFDSCGGLGIRVVDGSDSHMDINKRTHYYQPFVEGVPHAGLFLANGDECRLLGVTRSWVNDCDSAGSDDQPFRYGGSVGPVRMGESGTWLRLGQALSKQFKIRGLFGVDAIVTSLGEITPLEVNPRFTASMELLPPIEERTVVEWHIATCQTGTLPSQQSCLAAQGRQPLVGKGILYAPEEANAGQAMEWNDQLRQRLIRIAETNGATLADLPADGETISAGSPIMTVLVKGKNPEEIRIRLSWSPGELFDLIWRAA